MSAKKILIRLSLLVVVVASILSGAIADRLFGIKPLDMLFPSKDSGIPGTSRTIVKEESTVISVAEEVSPSVVTVTVEAPRRRILELNPFGGFQSRIEGGTPQDIGTGFVVSKDGLIVTNKHVVSEDNVKYTVVTKDNKEYEVKEIHRDPANDLAIIKIDTQEDLKPVKLGTSDGLKVGQFVIAIGTALGEFRHTVTTGVISGLGRGITAGNPYEGYVERLDDVIQTDAAINPGNSGGPLLNSAGEVIGVNVAVAQGAQNIGFAIPVDIVKDGLAQFESNGSFASKPFLGVEYQMISRQTALLNDVPQGAYITNVVSGTPAEKAGIEVDDIITKFDGQSLTEEGGLGEFISKKKVGDSVSLTIWRDGETKELKVTLGNSS